MIIIKVMVIIIGKIINPLYSRRIIKSALISHSAIF